jgi:hypothetical protein
VARLKLQAPRDLGASATVADTERETSRLLLIT